MALTSFIQQEESRLHTLKQYEILHTPPEASFDRLTALLARLLDVPIAALNLVDRQHIHHKSIYGADLRESPRVGSFCDHTVLSGECLVVPDAKQDARFSGSPFVAGPPFVRSYAGVPIRACDDSSLGTLCVMDYVPRDFCARECEILLEFAGVIVDQLQLRLGALQKAQMAEAIRNVHVGVVVTDPLQRDNPIIYANRAFQELTGYCMLDCVGRNCRFLQGEATDSAVIKEMGRAIGEERVFEGVLLNYRKDGSTFWNELTITPVFDSSGKIINFLGLQRDVTARTQAELDLRSNVEKLKETELLRENLVQMLIHDMRSPLTILLGNLELLASKAKNVCSKGELRLLANSAQGAQQLNDMVTSLLDVSRLEARKMPLQLSAYEMGSLTREALTDWIALEGSDRIRLEMPEDRLWVECDLFLTHRVIKNLISNALKFSPVSEPVQVQVLDRGTYVHLAVVDHGPGIPRQEIRNVFEKFTQLNASGQTHSSGLGLTFCKLAIEAQGGIIGVYGEPDEGSTFWFALPKRSNLFEQSPNGPCAKNGQETFDVSQAGKLGEALRAI